MCASRKLFVGTKVIKNAVKVTIRCRSTIILDINSFRLHTCTYVAIYCFKPLG